MIEALTKSFPMALGLALSPLPLIAIFMLLMTPRAKNNGISFLFGWVLGIILIGIVVLIIPFSLDELWKSAGISGKVQIVLGFFMFLTAIVVKWKGPKRTDPIKVPIMFRSLDKFGIKRSFSLGLFLSSFNVKNLALATAGAAQIRTVLEMSKIQSSLTLVLFAIISSLTMMIPVFIYAFSQERMDKLFLSWRNFLIKNQSLILVFVLLFFGALLIYLGIDNLNI